MSAAAGVKLSIPLRFRRGLLRGDERASVDSALQLLACVNEIVPLAGRKLLDFGCGVKLVQGLHELDYQLCKYTGVDVYREMIEHLRSQVIDPRFEFAALDFHNAMYNKAGRPMTADERLPIADDRFDVITMFSVITHMAPADTAATLSILRGYAADDARLVFSTFIDPNQPEDFVDKIPDRPLLNAFYRRSFIEQLVADAGWRILSLNHPVAQLIHHHYVCSPAPAAA